MGRHEAIPLDLPAPTARAVRAYRQTLETSLDALKASAAAIALQSARGVPGAQEALAALYLKIRATEFEIECNHAALELAGQEDAAAEIAWRAAIQTMQPAEIIAGIGKEVCCRRCTPGIAGGCVITASMPHAGARCWHPVKERDQFYRDDSGQRIFPYRGAPAVAKLFDAVCEKLNVRREFS
jgi:hypothetical protein